MSFSFECINSLFFIACSLFFNSFFSFISASFFFLSFSASNFSISSFIILSLFNFSCSIFFFSASLFISLNCNWYSSTCFLSFSSISFSFFEYSSTKSFFKLSNCSLFFFSLSSINFLFSFSISFFNSICAFSQSTPYISSPLLDFIYNNIVLVPKIITSFVFNIWPSSPIFFPLTNIWDLASLSLGFKIISSLFSSLTNIAWFGFIPIPDKTIWGVGLPCFLPTYTGNWSKGYFNLWLNCGSSFNTTKCGLLISTFSMPNSLSCFLASSNLSLKVLDILSHIFWVSSYWAFNSLKASLSTSSTTPPPNNFLLNSSIFFFKSLFSSFNNLTTLSCSLSLITALFWIFLALSAYLNVLSVSS